MTDKIHKIADYYGKEAKVERELDKRNFEKAERSDNA